MHVNSSGVVHVNSGGAFVHKNSCFSQAAEVWKGTKAHEYEYSLHGYASCCRESLLLTAGVMKVAW